MNDAVRSNIRSIATERGIPVPVAMTFLQDLHTAGLIEFRVIAGEAVHPEAAARSALARFSHSTSDPVALSDLRVADVEYVEDIQSDEG